MSAPPIETVLVTGASSGIGLELARCFAAEKSNLVLLARNTVALEKLAAELRDEFRVEVFVLTADLSLPETPQKIISELAAQKISVDVLVNNAGFGLQGKFSDLPLARQLEMIQVNVTALTSLTGLLLPEMVRRNRGGILNVSSVAGFMAGPNMAVYYASKAFVLSFTAALAEELSATNLKFSALCPGPTESNFGQVARGGRTRKIQTPKMSAIAVAVQGLKSFRAGKVICVPGFSNRLLALGTRLAPRRWTNKIVRKYNTMEE